MTLRLLEGCLVCSTVSNNSDSGPGDAFLELSNMEIHIVIADWSCSWSDYSVCRVACMRSGCKAKQPSFLSSCLFQSASVVGNQLPTLILIKPMRYVKLLRASPLCRATSCFDLDVVVEGRKSV